MSCLKLHWPQTLSLYCPAEADEPDVVDGDAPVVLSIRRAAARSPRSAQNQLLSRARLIYQNRCCPICSRGGVIPLDAQPALMTRDNMPVPGSGVLIGFECDACGHTWGAE